MDIEFEAKFVRLDTSALRKKIEQCGGKKMKDRFLMKRYTFDIPGKERGTFVRVRDEGDQVTVTYKQFVNSSIEGMKEIELVVDAFDKAVAFLKSIGMVQATYEENYREVYKLDGCEITFDTWPGLDEFVEIEGRSKEHVIGVIKKLDLELEEALYGNVDVIYQQEKDLDISTLKTITFADF